jgi:CBS domain-containing protein
MTTERRMVADYGTHELIGTVPSATLREAARLLRSADIGALVVRDHHGLVGLFAERDLVRALADGRDPDQATVGTAMSVPAVTARPEDRVLEVALLMLDRWIRHVPLVDADGHEWGMLSLRDLLRPLVVQALEAPIGAPGGG